ncbi:MAG: EAL domain-containing protein [Magnetococcales bacterium]|nr:EAL domain-containing protein [Magnetococcales bacterium]MBF0157099.1 EAL domain-containing protein [Magnetococcales bacterium]
MQEPESRRDYVDAGSLSPWKVAVVDDDPDIHILTRRLLRDFTFEGRGVECLSGYSGEEARELVRRHPDTAVLLLDVAMESPLAGLEAVRFIRESLENRLVRIVLRTGRASQVPEQEVVLRFDVNDYREKSELTSGKFVAMVVASLRAFRDLVTIRQLSLSNEVLEQRVAERTRALEESNRRLEGIRQSLTQAQRIAQIGNWDWDPDTDRLTCSAETLRILGLTRESFGNSGIAGFLMRIHEAEREGVRRVIGSILRGGGSLETEFRVVRPGGEIRVVLGVGELLRDVGAGLRRLVYTLQDVTERRRVEDRLETATRVFRSAMEEVGDQLKVTSKVLENAIEGVVICDREGVIGSVNPAFSEITGFLSEEVIGRDIRQLRSGHHDDAFFSGIMSQLHASGQWRGEVWGRRKNGEAYPQMLSATVLRSPDGEVVNYVLVFNDISEVKRSQEELHYKTFHDVLSGLPNRELFRDHLQLAMRQADRQGRSLAVLLFDLDRFQTINDSLGHAWGDVLLKEVARRMAGCVRRGDTVSRLSGDEFAVLIQEVDNVQDILFSVHKLVAALAEAFAIGSHQVNLTVSIGITLYPEDGSDADLLLKNAGIAVNRAKEAGRDNYQFFTREMSRRADRRLSLESSLRLALERGEFELHYQPRLGLVNDRIVGAEALVRWRRNGELVPPGEFISLAEETGLIVPMGRWILETACRQNQAWREEGLPDLRVSVNLSGRQFQHQDLQGVVEEVLAGSGLPPRLLELEITESMVMREGERAIAILESLRGLGLSVAIDDFGTGYSSLSYLKRFPIQILKIDRSFVKDLAKDPRDLAIVNAIVSMAAGLDLSVVAEGVEDEAQREILRRAGCDEYQGFLRYRPLPAAEIPGVLRRS